MLEQHVLALRPASWALLCPAAEPCDPLTCLLVHDAAASFMAGPPPPLLGLFRVGVDNDGTFLVGGRL